MAALQSLWPSEREGTKLWSLRVNRTGEFKQSRPCDECLTYLKQQGVKSIHYYDENLNLVMERL